MPEVERDGRVPPPRSRPDIGVGGGGSRRRIALLALWRALRENVARKKFAQDVGVLTCANFLGAALNLVQGILVARWLDPGLYGVAGLVMLYPRLVYGLFDGGSGAAAIKFFGAYYGANDRERALAVCKVSLLVDAGLALAALAFVLASARLAATWVVHDAGVADLIVLYGLSIVPRVFVGTCNALLVTLGRSPLVALIESAGNLLRVALVVVLVLGGWQVAGVVWGNAIATVALGLFYVGPAWVLVRRACGGSIRTARLRSLESVRSQLWSFFVYNKLQGLLTLIPTHLDSILLGYFRGPTEVGFYRLAKNLAEVVEYLRVPLFSVSYAQLARVAGTGDEAALREKVRRMAFAGLPLGLCVVAGALLVPALLPVLVGTDYAPAILAAQILIVGAGLSLPFYWLRAVYLVKNFVRELFVVSFGAAAVVMAAFPLAVNRWGFLGAAGAMLALHAGETLVRAGWLWHRSASAERMPGRVQLKPGRLESR